MIQEIAVDVISSRVAAAVCTAPPIRDNSSRRTVIQEQATAESFLNITYTPLLIHFRCVYSSLWLHRLYGSRNMPSGLSAMQLFDAGKNVEADLPGFVATGCIVLQNLPLSETACRASGFLSVPIACIAKENGIVFDKNLPSPTAEK